MKILGLDIENYRRVKTISLVPKGNVTRVNGANGSGKTSTLDAILAVLAGAGALALVPVHDGEEKGQIRLTLGEESAEYVVTRTFTVNGTTRLKVESPEGAEYPRPQEFLGKLFGALSLDPLEFQRMAPKDRLATLRQIVTLDADVDELDAQNAADFEKRSDVNRQIKALDERVHLYAGGLPAADADLSPIDTKTMLDKMEDAARHNSAVEQERTRRENARAAADHLLERANRLVAEAIELRRRADELDQEAGFLNTQHENDTARLAALPQLEESIDVSDVRRQLQDADRENATRSLARTQRENYLKADAEYQTALARAKQLTGQMEYRNQLKAEAIANAKFPIPGLAFGDLGVLFNDFPFDQASGAEQLRVSFAIAAALHPKLPVVVIKDGSLLDETSMGLLEDLAIEYGAQVFIERVGQSNIGFLLEDGEIVAVDGVPVAA
jgi:predicted ATP-dependent endonuclease of OLD family